MNERIAKLLSDHGFFMFGKFYGSLGHPSPLYITSSKLYTQPEKMAAVAEEVGKFMAGRDIDLVAGTEVSGTPLAVAVSYATLKPFVYIRRKLGADGKRREVLEGLYRRGEKVLVVDDGIGTGETKRKFIEMLKDHGLVVNEVLVLYDAEVSHLPYYTDHNIQVHAFVKHNELVRYMEEHEYISHKLAQQLYDFWKNISTIQKDEARWKRFIELAVAEGFTFQ